MSEHLAPPEGAQEQSNEDNLPLRADPPHHFVKHGDCTYKVEYGPSPEEERYLREALLQDRVSRLQEENDALRRAANADLRSTEAVVLRAERDANRDAYVRMKENFQRSLATTRNLEDELYRLKSGSPFDEPTLNPAAKVLPPEFLAWAKDQIKACESSGWAESTYVGAGLTLGQLRSLL